MKKLHLLPSPPMAIDRYIDIRDSKQPETRNVLIANHAHVADQYASFDAAVVAQSLNALTAATDCALICDELRSCYSVKTQALARLKKKIRSVQPKGGMKYCPMCGTTRGKTFDHYLPAEDYPEFSVHAANLVPCCALCNSIKDRYLLDSQGRRYFVHAYSDDIPDTQFLFADLHVGDDFDGVGATFRIEEPENVDPEIWRLLRSHYRRLKLLDRFDEDSGDEIDSILQSCKAHLDAGGSKPRLFLRKMARSTSANHGRNHWLSVLMSEMADHAALRDWIAAA